MEFKNLDDKVKIKLVNHIDDTYQDLWEGPLRGCLSEIEKAYNWDYYIEEETFPKEIDDRFILVVPNNKFDFTTNEFIGFINDLGVLNITSCPEGPSGRLMRTKKEILEKIAEVKKLAKIEHKNEHQYQDAEGDRTALLLMTGWIEALNFVLGLSEDTDIDIGRR